MKVEMRDEKTLVITPETTAEQIVLAAFAGGDVKVETPKPFQQNVTPLVIEKKQCPSS